MHLMLETYISHPTVHGKWGLADMIKSTNDLILRQTAGWSSLLTQSCLRVDVFSGWWQRGSQTDSRHGNDLALHLCCVDGGGTETASRLWESPRFTANSELELPAIPVSLEAVSSPQTWGVSSAQFTYWLLPEQNTQPSPTEDFCPETFWAKTRCCF